MNQLTRQTLAPPSSDVAQIETSVSDLRAAFESGRTRSARWREQQLDGIERLLRENESRWLDALHADVGKPEMEAYGAEVAHCCNGVRTIRRGLRKWMKPRRVSTPLLAMPGQSRILAEPLGVGLIIAPWNYPCELALSPLAGAVAAGNCAVVKPSEVAPRTSAMLADLIPRYLDGDCVKVIEGGVPETTALLDQRFDHIFYTGNGSVGRVVMTAAAKHLTPVTLELGGKSPVIVDEDVDLDLCVKRLVWGKFYNAGQTCIAPDYALVHHRRFEEFKARIEETVHRFWGQDPQRSPDYGRIVNTRHHRRLAGLLQGQTPLFGGQMDESDRYISPTVLVDVDTQSPVMQDEIFGPLLPIFPIEGVDQAIDFINARPKPLALYLFSNRRAVQEKVVARTSSGGMLINHVILHIVVPGLPFGGVGASGIGAYHGQASFDTFSHLKGILRRGFRLDPGLIYPPYDERKKSWLRRLL